MSHPRSALTLKASVLRCPPTTPQSSPGFNGTVAQALRPFPHYGRITEHMESEGQSSYNALKVDLQRRFGQGLQVGVSYTFAKLLTDAAEDLFGTTPISGVIQNPYDRESLWSPSTNVVPHAFVANYLYELPFGKNKPFLNRGKALNAIFGGWQFTGVLRYRQGPGLVPFIAGRSRDFLDLIGFTGNLRPNVTGPTVLHRQSARRRAIRVSSTGRPSRDRRISSR